MKYKGLLNFVNYRKALASAEFCESIFDRVEFEFNPSDGVFGKDVGNYSITTDLCMGKIRAPFKFLLPCAYCKTQFLSQILGISDDLIEGIVRGSKYLVPSPLDSAVKGNWKIGGIEELFAKPMRGDVLLFGDAFEYMLKSISLKKLLDELSRESIICDSTDEWQKIAMRIDAVEFAINNKIQLCDLVTDRILVIPSVFNTMHANLPSSYWSKAVYLYSNAIKAFERFKNQSYPTYSKLYQFNCGKLIIYIEEIFKYLEQKSITFKDELRELATLLNKLPSFDVSQCKKGVKITLPLKFFGESEGFSIYIKRGKNGRVLSDCGEVVKLLEEHTEFECESDMNRFYNACKKYQIGFERGEFFTSFNYASSKRQLEILLNFAKTLTAFIKLYNV